jgi:acetyl/propionyl-CoA carboxylase alpha subunit
MRTVEVTLDGKEYTVELSPDPEDRTRYVAVVDGTSLPVYVPESLQPGSPEWMVVDNRPYELILDDGLDWLISSGGMYRLAVRWLDVTQARPSTNEGRVKAPIPGIITRVLVEPGSVVEAGEPLLVLEAMKMENEVRAPRSGSVHAVGVKVGQTVVLGELMVEIG